MHPSVNEYVGMRVKQHGLRELSVLECGSRNYNGTVRGHFSGPYVGIDIQEGPMVDLVASAADLPFPPDHFDVVVTAEMLEHDPSFWLSIPEMARVLKPGGHLILTTRGIGFPYHEYPGDYWRFTQDSIRLLVDTAGLVILDVQDDWYPGHSGVFAHAQKP